MAIQEIEQEQEQLGSAELAKARLDFAERCLVNAQDLSRMIDLKASFLLSAVALMTAALGIVASKALEVTTDEGLRVALKAVGLVSFLAYVVLAFLVVYVATQVFRALGKMLTRESLAPGLIFPLTVLERHKADDVVDEEKYFRRLANVSSNDIIRDYSNQVLEVSAVYHRKQAHINTSVRLFQYLSISWIVTMLLFLSLLATNIFR
jgi:hypothetical protein